MGWEREFEHWRDMGHTWGPGIDDRREPTEEEILENGARMKSYEKELEILRVYPREKYVKAGEELKAGLPSSHDITFGTAPYHWREDYSVAKMNLCKQATEELGYEFGFPDWPRQQKNEFCIKVEHYGYMQDRGGNIHTFTAKGIDDPMKCLQLVADFEAIGCRTTTYWLEKDRFISEGDTGRLYKEMERWGVSFNKKEALDKEIKQLAAELDQFVYDFDPYEYKDAVEDRESALSELEKNIEKGEVGHIKDWHKDITLEAYDTELVLESMTLMKWLERVQMKLQKEKVVSLDERLKAAQGKHPVTNNQNEKCVEKGSVKKEKDPPKFSF